MSEKKTASKDKTRPVRLDFNITLQSEIERFNRFKEKRAFVQDTAAARALINKALDLEVGETTVGK